jgi:lysophospholipase L1-like esterase
MVFLVVFASVLGVKFYMVTRSKTNTDFTRWRDMSLNQVNNWCMQPNVTTCKCANPLKPTPRHGHKTWTEAHLENIKLARNHNVPKKSPFRETDVVFLGDSIIEGWRGTSLGQQVEKKEGNIKVFEELFDMDKGGEFDGIALGISGDKSQNLLWRIRNGEMPKNLKSKVYWILIGTNDFLKGDLEQCSEEVVFMGIQRILEEMMIIRPESTIVVNGLLPRSDVGKKTDGRLYEEDEKTVMDAIDSVNNQLEEFCKLHEDLEYFDPSGLFVEEDPELGDGKFSKYISKELMKDRLHPTPFAYRKWGKTIIERLRLVLDGKLNVERRGL